MPGPRLLLRNLAASDLHPVDALLRAAYGFDMSYLPRLHRYVAIEPEGWVVAERRGEIVGVGFFATFGPCAYIGLMGVAPAAQRGGVGTAIFEEILARTEARSTRLLLLDASAAGAPLYERSGFDDHGEAFAYHADLEACRAPLPHESDGAIVRPLSALTDADLDAVCALDAAGYGADRSRLVALYATADRARTLVAFESSGKIAGYAVAQSRSVGPVVASDPAVAAGLIRRALALPFDAQRVSLLIAGQNSASVKVMARLGFVRDRTLRHMRRGDESALTSDWSQLYAKGSFAVG